MKLQTPYTQKRMQLAFGHPSWALIAAFGTYFCMYGFRKPYTAATYTGTIYFGLDYKYLLIITQTLGYVLSKWSGIKIIAEIKPVNRVKTLIAFVLGAELMLFFFGIIPRPWNTLCLLLNGLFLGLVFGLVLGFLEGRKNTEALIAGLCASFIVSDGVSKSVGTFLLNQGVAENWMPFFAGALFIVPTLVFTAMLSMIPPPSPEDMLSRTERVPMHASSRRIFFLKYAPGLSAIVLMYLFVTLLRSIRADFAPELWRDLGYIRTPALFTSSELVVSFCVVLINGFAILILHHLNAFRYALLTCFAGFVLILLALMSLKYGMPAFPFMVLIGLGVYVPYVAVHTTIFERLIALTKERANLGFLMYIADSVGYTGYIILMLLRYFTPAGTSILSMFLTVALMMGVCGSLVVLFCNRYFIRKFKFNHSQDAEITVG